MIIVISNFLGSHDGSVSGNHAYHRSGISSTQHVSGNNQSRIESFEQAIRRAQQNYKNAHIDCFCAGAGDGRRIPPDIPREVVMAAAVPAAVLSATKNTEVREAMLLGSSLEGGWNPPYGVGDGGTSFGPYQMHEGGALTASGLSPAQAENAVTATKAMMAAYVNGVNSISASLWKTNPEQAAEQAAVIAERPAQDYFATDGTAAVNAHWANVQAALAGQSGSSGTPNGSGTSSTTTGNSTLDSILSFFGVPTLSSFTSGLKSDAERVGLVVFGALLVLVGILIFALPAAAGAARTAAKTGAAIEGGAAVAGLELGSKAAASKDRQRRQAIADRSLAIGQQNANTKAQREARLART